MNLYVYNDYVYVCNMIENRVKICIYLLYFFFFQGFELMIQVVELGFFVDMFQVVYNIFVYIYIYTNNIEICRYILDFICKVVFFIIYMYSI